MWNYRIVVYKDGSGCGLHEVYYNDKGKPYAMTEKPIDFTNDDPKTLVKMIACAVKDAVVQKPLREPEKWAKNPTGKKKKKHND